MVPRVKQQLLRNEGARAKAPKNSSVTEKMTMIAVFMTAGQNSGSLSTIPKLLSVRLPAASVKLPTMVVSTGRSQKAP